nr:G protein-coupled receptor [Proales similis]
MNQEALIEFYSNANSMLGKYFGGIVGSIGVLLNIIQAAIFLGRKRLNDNNNMGVLCGMIALFDATYLFLAAILLAQFLPGLGIILLFEHELICRTGYFILRATVHMSSWLQVLVSFERFMIINFRAKSHFLRRKSNVYGMMLAMFVLLCLLNSLNLTYTISLLQIPVNGTNQTIKFPVCLTPAEIAVWVKNLTLILRTLAPSLLIFIFNAKTISKIRSSRRSVCSQTSDRLSRADIQFAFTVCILNGLFFVSYLPIVIQYVHESIQQLINPVVSNTRLKISIDGFLLGIALSLAHFYQSSTFFINLAANRLFRAEIAAILNLKSTQDNTIFSTSNANRSARFS